MTILDYVLRHLWVAGVSAPLLFVTMPFMAIVSYLGAHIPTLGSFEAGHYITVWTMLYYVTMFVVDLIGWLWIFVFMTLGVPVALKQHLLIQVEMAHLTPQQIGEAIVVAWINLPLMQVLFLAEIVLFIPGIIVWTLFDILPPLEDINWELIG